MGVFTSMFARDLKLAMRRWSELATPLIFFVIISSLFPFALSPEVAMLRSAGTGVLWIAALLSSLVPLSNAHNSFCVQLPGSFLGGCAS